MNEDQLRIQLLDPDLLVLKNELKQITNPTVFRGGKTPNEDGLLSETIFGISSVDRGGIFAYIDLGGTYFHPLVYKVWASMDKSVKDLVYGNKNYTIDENGYFVEDENGETGIDFIKRNINKIKIKRTTSSKRDDRIEFIEKNKKNLFMTKCIVIPAYYRDVNTTEDGPVGIGEINSLYNTLLRSVRSVEDTKDYGFDLSNSMRGRIQDTLASIYDWFIDEPNLSKKDGLIRRSVLSKTSDYSSRLVISAPSIDGDRAEDLMVNTEFSAVPLSSLCANFFPFVIFHLKSFFQNEFSTGKYPYVNEKGEIEYVDLKDPEIEFSDERLKKEVDRFIRGFSNRLVPIEVPNIQNKKIYMKFKGRTISVDELDEPGNTPLLDRRLTWCDVLFMAVYKATIDKHILITRFPLENYMGQVPTKIRVLSTNETEPMFVDNTSFRWYPKIRESDIGSNTSNTFIDTLRMSNTTVVPMGGDYDGDQVSVKGVYSIEANKECEDYIKSKVNFISIGGENVKTSSNESVQAIFNLTRVLEPHKLTEPKF